MFGRKKRPSDSYFYGDGNTIHDTDHIDVEVDSSGEVVAVWFRCKMLPFKARAVDDNRAMDMRTHRITERITGITIKEH